MNDQFCHEIALKIAELTTKEAVTGEATKAFAPRFIKAYAAADVIIRNQYAELYDEVLAQIK